MGFFARLPGSTETAWVDGLEVDPGWVQPGTVWSSRAIPLKVVVVLQRGAAPSGGDPQVEYFRADRNLKNTAQFALSQRLSRFLQKYIPVGRPEDFEHLRGT